ncbi:S8 family serine peptidase [Kiloniella antarctica]|uniref:S8 family serine peptidase n=1 Tax=Kiloniella antarctica TaxID=1550907 RepID=A0ABW5BK49_9PROT
MLRSSFIFLLLSVMLGTSGITFAQTSSDPSRIPLPAGLDSKGDVRSKGRPDIVFSGLRASCVRPGSIITIKGKNFDQLDRKNLALDDNGNLIELDVLSKNNTQISSYLPKDKINLNRTYDIVFYSKRNFEAAEKTGLSVRICPANGEMSKDIARVQDVLILVDGAQKNAILGELQRRRLPVVQIFTLNALQSVLVQTRTSNAKIVIQELRNSFPQAEIDFNNDLTSSSNPRLYAKKAIGWDDKSGCHYSQLEFPIGLLDGAIDKQHSAFLDQNIISREFIDDEIADKTHATSIGSILIGNSAQQGYSGLVPGTTLYNAVVLRVSETREQLASTIAVIQGLDWLLSNKVRLINVSLSSEIANRVLIKGFVISLEQGAIVFSSAGNQGADAPQSYPAAIEGIFSITAIDSLGKIYQMANQGRFIDFAAPGVDIWAAVPGNKGAYVSGTSFASPHALAIASLTLKNNPLVSREVLLKALTFSLVDLGVPGRDPVFGAGLLKSVC